MAIELNFPVLKKNNFIILFTDFNSKIGLGNYIRAQSLKKNIEKRKIKVHLFFNIKKSHKLNQILKKYQTPKLVLIDSPIINKIIIEQYKSVSKVLCFDWFGKFVPNYNIAIYEHSKLRATNKIFSGIKYINLRKEITKLSINKKIIDNKFLIVIGGGDINNQGLRLAKYITEKGFVTTLVIGPLSKYKKLEIIHKRLKLYKSDKHFPEILSSHNNIITNAGTCLFESHFLNKNIYVLPQTTKEKTIAKYFYKNKLILGFGFNNIKKFNFKKFNNLKPNKKIVDGKGLDRVTNIITKIFKK